MNRENLELIAKAIGVEARELLAATPLGFGEEECLPNNTDGEVVRIKLPETLSDWPDARLVAFMRQVLAMTKLAGGAELLNKREGCVELTVKLSRADSERLIGAYERGELDSLGVIDVAHIGVPLTPDMLAAFKIIITHKCDYLVRQRWPRPWEERRRVFLTATKLVATVASLWCIYIILFETRIVVQLIGIICGAFIIVGLIYSYMLIANALDRGWLCGIRSRYWKSRQKKSEKSQQRDQQQHPE
jgi:hypothetical protein